MMDYIIAQKCGKCNQKLQFNIILYRSRMIRISAMADRAQRSV